MNYIVLEGLGLYALYIILLLLSLATIGSIVCAIITDRRNVVLEKELCKEKGIVRFLYRQNFVLKLKSGEFDFDEE